MNSVLENPHQRKKLKELDDNNPTKKGRKNQKVIAGLVREGWYMIYIYQTVFDANLRIASNITQRRISRWFKIHFPEYLTVYGNQNAINVICSQNILRFKKIFWG